MSTELDYFRKTPVRKLLKYQVLQFLPGWRGLHYKRKLIEANAPRTFAAFEAAERKAEGMIAIDLGANRGVFARRMARTASHVHAFEPDPWTAGVLRKELEDLCNVTVHEVAAGAAAGKLPIFRHRDYESNPEGLSQSTTLLSDVSDVDASKAIAEVEVIDFPEFVRGLGEQVGILKIDIEGGELELMPALLDSDVLQNIDFIFCETHERILPTRLGEFAEIRARARESEHPVINMDWL